MHLVVNGFTRTVTQDTGLLDLLACEGFPPKQVIVEVNRKYIPHDELSRYVLRDGDTIEFILPAFGG